MRDAECLQAIRTGQGWYDYEPDEEKVSLAIEVLRMRGYRITERRVASAEFNKMLHTLSDRELLAVLRVQP